MTTATVRSLSEITGTYTLDPAHSRIGFVARHAMVTKVRGAYFLDVENHPTITFVSTSARHNGDVYELTGDLTVKGITKSVTVPFTYEGAATDPFGNLRVGFEGSVTVSRKDYGLTWNAPPRDRRRARRRQDRTRVRDLRH